MSLRSTKKGVANLSPPRGIHGETEISRGLRWAHAYKRKGNTESDLVFRPITSESQCKCGALWVIALAVTS